MDETLMRRPLLAGLADRIRHVRLGKSKFTGIAGGAPYVLRMGSRSKARIL